MINHYKDITSENPIKEVWKLLKYFQDANFTIDKQRLVNKISDEEYKQEEKNIKKQAKQIDYCIRQAEQYFQAASQVGLATRPNLLYYSAVSLSRALILLKRDGSYSFDVLRKEEKHNHHSLEFDKSFKSSNLKSLEDFFSSLRCEIYTKPDNKQKFPWGNFPLFYKTLVPYPISVHVQKRFRKRDGLIETIYPINFASIIPIDELIDNKFNLLSLITRLPELYYDLHTLGIKPNLYEGSIGLILDSTGLYQEEGDKVIEPSKAQLFFFIDNISRDDQGILLDIYRSKNPDICTTETYDFNLSFKIERDKHIERNQLQSDMLPDFEFGNLPPMVDNINGKIFYIYPILTPKDLPTESTTKLNKLKKVTELQELISHFMILFCLGMLCRYYPDVWMKIIDENVLIAEFTDTLLNIISRKFPNLILDQMTLTKHHIHL